jgi:hypothetical protein
MHQQHLGRTVTAAKHQKAGAALGHGSRPPWCCVGWLGERRLDVSAKTWGAEAVA